MSREAASVIVLTSAGSVNAATPGAAADELAVTDVESGLDAELGPVGPIDELVHAASRATAIPIAPMRGAAFVITEQV